VGVLFLVFFNSCVWSKTVSWTAWKEETFQALPKIPGWCSREKANKIMDFLYQTQPKQCVEIGAFCGSTTYPIVRSIQYLGRGRVWTIDAWDTQKAVEGLDPHDPNFVWWTKVDMKSCYHQLLSLISQKGLTKWCRVTRANSQDALATFPDGSIDFIYIDGSSSSGPSLRDVTLSYRKVKRGGYIWLNDSHYISRLGSVAYLMERCTWLREVSLTNQSIVFKKE
jgi:predicted O-methyltransferase YrrM